MRSNLARIIPLTLMIIAGCATSSPVPVEAEVETETSAFVPSTWVVRGDTARLDTAEFDASMVWRCTGDAYEVLLVIQEELTEPIMVETRFSTSLDTAPAVAWTPVTSPGTVLRLPRTGEALDRWSRSARSRRTINSTDDALTVSVTDAAGETRTYRFVTHGITEAHQKLPCKPALPR